MLSFAVAVLISASQPVGAEPRPQSERGRKIEAFWSGVFAAPSEHSLAVGLSVGRQFWERAYGGYGNNLHLRVQARRSLSGWLPGGDWLSVGALLDYGSDTGETSTLKVRNRQTMIGASGGLMRWFGRFRLEASIEAGVLVSTVMLSDGVSPDRHDVAVEPSAGLLVAGAVSIAGVSAVGLRGGVRYRPGRLNIVLLIDVDWLIGASGAEQPNEIRQERASK